MWWQKQLLMVDHSEQHFGPFDEKLRELWTSLWPAGRVIQSASAGPSLTNRFTQRPINVIKDKSGTIQNN